MATIIKLPPDKWESYRTLRLEALREEPQAFCSSYKDMEQMPPEYWQGRLAEAARGINSWLLFAVDGEQLVGMIGASYEKPGLSTQIISLYVTKGSRRKGVGRALIKAILSEIEKSQNIHKVSLEVSQDQIAAIRLYRQLGFQVISSTEEQQGDGQIFVGYRMEKWLKQPE